MCHGYAMDLRRQKELLQVLRMEPLVGVDAEDFSNFAQPVHAHDALALFVKANHLIRGMDFSRQFVAGYAERLAPLFYPFPDFYYFLILRYFGHNSSSPLKP